MKALLLLFFFLASPAQAKTSDYLSGGKCYPSFPFYMVIAAKIDETHFAVTQSGATIAAFGFVELVRHKPHPEERLNIGVQFLTSKEVKLGDGFVHSVDLWKECQL